MFSLSAFPRVHSSMLVGSRPAIRLYLQPGVPSKTPHHHPCPHPCPHPCHHPCPHPLTHPISSGTHRCSSLTCFNGRLRHSFRVFLTKFCFDLKSFHDFVEIFVETYGLVFEKGRNCSSHFECM